jgi:DNA modification methylase
MSELLDAVVSDRFAAYNNDCCEVVPTLPTESVGFSVYSLPFSNLFIYSDSDRDMGNATNDGEFLEHYAFLVRELYRVLKPGRLVAVHCSDLPRTKATHGVVGLYDLPGDIRAVHEAAGFTYHSRVTIWKDPVVEMQRTKAIGLLHKQLLKDSSRSRVGMPDYLMVFRKDPGDEKAVEKIGHVGDEMPVSLWQQWASPVWMDICQTDVLNVRIARENDDEKHLCPLQLPVIERCVRLWSNPNDIVLSPFMGIGSEGFVSLKAGRRFVGVELKPAYFRQAVKNLNQAIAERGSLFEDVA